MVVVPLAASEHESAHSSALVGKSDARYWVRVAAAASLAASGALLMTGKRRAGLAVAVAGTALTIIDQQETVRDFWNRLPGYLADVQDILTHVQGTVDQLSAQGKELRTILSR